MKKTGKIVTLVFLASAATGAIHVLNKSISFLSDRLKALPYDNGNNYSWRFGNIFYTKQGSGSPLLLVHDLTSYSSNMEWKELVDQYAKEHTVYTLDLLGCGRSDKPAMTYTNYLYVQLVSDFIREVIGTRTNVIATGDSASFITMACFLDQTLFDKIIFINPTSLSVLNQVPSHNSKLAKFLFDIPVIGTLLFNICNNRTNIEKTIKNKCYSNPYIVSSSTVDTFYEASHKNGSGSKYLFSSVTGKFTTVNILRALREINNSMCILYGNDEPNMELVVEEYATINPIIESQAIYGTKHLPQLEKPNSVYEATKIFLI